MVLPFCVYFDHLRLYNGIIKSNKRILDNHQETKSPSWNDVNYAWNINFVYFIDFSQGWIYYTTQLLRAGVTRLLVLQFYS